MLKKIGVFAASLLVLMAPLAPLANATGVNSNIATVNLSMSVGESITVTGLPSSVSFNYTPGSVVNASSPLSVTTTWNLAPGHSSLTTAAYFTGTGSAALTNGAVNIPSSQFSLSDSVLGSLGAFSNSGLIGSAGGVGGNFTGVLPTSGAFFTQSVTSVIQGNHTNTLTLSLDETSYTASPLAAGAYTGSINFIAWSN